MSTFCQVSSALVGNVLVRCWTLCWNPLKNWFRLAACTLLSAWGYFMNFLSLSDSVAWNFLRARNSQVSRVSSMPLHLLNRPMPHWRHCRTLLQMRRWRTMMLRTRMMRIMRMKRRRRGLMLTATATSNIEMQCTRSFLEYGTKLKVFWGPQDKYNDKFWWNLPSYLLSSPGSIGPQPKRSKDLRTISAPASPPPVTSQFPRNTPLPLLLALLLL